MHLAKVIIAVELTEDINEPMTINWSLIYNITNL